MAVNGAGRCFNNNIKSGSRVLGKGDRRGGRERYIVGSPGSRVDGNGAAGVAGRVIIKRDAGSVSRRQGRQVGSGETRTAEINCYGV